MTIKCPKQDGNHNPPNRRTINHIFQQNWRETSLSCRFSPGCPCTSRPHVCGGCGWCPPAPMTTHAQFVEGTVLYNNIWNRTCQWVRDMQYMVTVWYYTTISEIEHESVSQWHAIYGYSKRPFPHHVHIETMALSHYSEPVAGNLFKLEGRINLVVITWLGGLLGGTE